MNKIKLAVFCALIVAIVAQSNLDAGDNRSRHGQTAQKGEKRENKGGTPGQQRRSQRRNRRGERHGKGNCKGEKCGMKKSATAQ